MCQCDERDGAQTDAFEETVDSSLILSSNYYHLHILTSILKPMPPSKTHLELLEFSVVLDNLYSNSRTDCTTQTCNREDGNDDWHPNIVHETVDSPGEEDLTSESWKKKGGRKLRLRLVEETRQDRRSISNRHSPMIPVMTGSAAKVELAIPAACRSPNSDATTVGSRKGGREMKVEFRHGQTTVTEKYHFQRFPSAISRIRHAAIPSIV